MAIMCARAIPIKKCQVGDLAQRNSLKFYHFDAVLQKTSLHFCFSDCTYILILNYSVFFIQRPFSWNRESQMKYLAPIEKPNNYFGKLLCKNKFTTKDLNALRGKSERES